MVKVCNIPKRFGDTMNPKLRSTNLAMKGGVRFIPKLLLVLTGSFARENLERV